MQLSHDLARRLIYIAAAASAVLIATWTSLAVQIPNPDALIYLRSAEHFANGDFGQAIAVYRWPFYSMLIAGLHLATGLPMMTAAHLADGAFLVVTVVAFIALTERLLPGRLTVLTLAAVLIVLHPKLMEMRSALIRDHGFHAFYLSALYFTARDIAIPRLLSKALILVCIGLATLFRLEAAVLAALIPAFYLFNHFQTWRARLMVVAGLALMCMMALPGYILWTGVIHRLIAGEPIDVLNIVTWHVNTISNRIEWLRAVIPAGRNTGEFAYIGATILIFAENVLRAITYPLAVLAFLAFYPRPIMPPFATRFTLWFVGWQIPILLIFTTFQLYLDWRYAMGLAFVAAIPAIAAIDMLIGELRAGTRRARLGLPVLAVIVIASFIANIPDTTRNIHLKKAGEWVGQNLPQGVLIATNEARIALFSGRPYPEEVQTYGKATAIDWANVGYVVVDIGRSNTPPADPVFGAMPVVARIDGDNGGSVLVYRVKAELRP